MKTIIDFLSVKQKTVHEWAASCPSCGGNDRFVILTNRPKGGAFFCRGCEAKGDGIAYLMEFRGMSYPEACKALDIPLQDGKSSVPKTIGKLAPQQEAFSLPGKEWMQAAADFVAQCSRNLSHPEAIAALKARGLTIATAQKLSIGWSTADIYPLRQAWGLPEVQGKTKLLLPRGLVIPTRRKSGIVAVTMRCADDKPKDRPKYWQIQGSSNAPYVVGEVKKPVFLFESALDAVLLWQEMQGQCAAMAFMGSTKGIDKGTAAFICNAPLVIACPDDDDAGHKAWNEWRKLFPSAVRVRPLEGKDLTDMHLMAAQGGNTPTTPTVQQWAEIALEIANPKCEFVRTSAMKIENPTQGIGPKIDEGVSKFRSNDTQGIEREKIDFNSMTLAEICANPELVRAYREQPHFSPHEVCEDILCPKPSFAWRSKRECLNCAGDEFCIMPLLENPYAMESVQ